MRVLGVLETVIRSIGVATAWLTVVPIAFFTGLQMLDRKLHLGVSAILPDLSTSLLFILIFMTFGFTYLRGRIQTKLDAAPPGLDRTLRLSTRAAAFSDYPFLVRLGWAHADNQIRGNRHLGSAPRRRDRACLVGTGWPCCCVAQHCLPAWSARQHCTELSGRHAAWGLNS